MYLLNYLQDDYLVQKFFRFVHMVGFVSWFAALLYLCRLFVYHKLTLEKGKKEVGDDQQIETFHMMEVRLYRYIALPSMAMTLGAGISLAILGDFFKQPWMHTKLMFVIFLIGYTHHLGFFIKKLKKNAVKQSSCFFRWYNEAATILLIIITSLAVFKSRNIALAAAFILILIFISFFNLMRMILATKGK